MSPRERRPGGGRPRSTMQDRPLLIASMLRHAATCNGSREIVSRVAGGAPVRYGFADAEVRARRAAQALARLGVRAGDRVATLAWNTHRHFELFYAAPGMGAVLHTVNPRLWDEQIAYIVDHAEDRVLCFDADLLPLVERLAPRLATVRHYVLLGGTADLPARTALPLLAYDELLAREDGEFAWPELDEREAAFLCYTSGTTGHPKGVLCSHRSTVLHALAAQSANALALTPFDTVLLVVPLFHAYGWGLPYVSALAGAKLVLPGAAPDARVVVDLIHAERATLAMGVPTVWTGIFAELDASGRDLGSLRRALIGGSSIPPAMSGRLRRRHGVEVVTGWGMTELSPIGSFTGSTPEIEALPAEEREAALYRTAGRILFPLEIEVVDAAGTPVPHDGATAGEIRVRGPCVTGGYFRDEGGAAVDADGWLRTGDVGTLDRHGAVRITDRAKDLIKSGGEWISSTELEAAACACPGVAQAAAVAVPHPKWQERPLLVVVPEAGARPTPEAVLGAMKRRVARWQLPDEVVLAESLPLTATGKIDKKVLRQRYADRAPAHPESQG